MNDGTVICPRLIEVALPIRELSAESLRQKKAQRGHISTLHLWWARRPLSAARAIVFASLVPDPDDDTCPPEFAATVARLLRDRVPDALTGYWRGRRRILDSDPYLPYGGLDDTLRNRLLMFIARWSPEWLEFERGERSKQPSPPEMLDDRCLVKWEIGDPESEPGGTVLRIARELIRSAHGGDAPTVLDPFSGGGAIPLEAGRLGCKPIANDYNPVAYLILRATCEYPQRYGKPGRVPPVEPLIGEHGASTRSHRRTKKRVRDDQASLLTASTDILTSTIFPSDANADNCKAVDNILIHDVEFWVNWVVEQTRNRIGHVYPPGADGKPVAGYIWARTIRCTNPTCRAEIPLIRSLVLSSKEGKRAVLTMGKQGQDVVFRVVKGRAMAEADGTMLSRGDCRCPICEQITPVEDIRRAGLDDKMGARMVAVITEDTNGRSYRTVESTDLEAFEEAKRRAAVLERPTELILPEITGVAGTEISNSTGIRVHLYGMRTWGSLFNSRQLLVIQTLVACLRDALDKMEERKLDFDYRLAIGTYLALWISRSSARYCSVTVWHKGEEKFEHPFGRQAIPMTWDYPEPNPFVEGSAGLTDAWDLISRVIHRESSSHVSAAVLNVSAANLPLSDASAHVVVTDPPYFDAIAYADLSDYFYVWLKRSLGDIMPDVFATPLTPKGAEATALRHRHEGSELRAKEHFSSMLGASLAEARRICRPDGIIVVMFAHQSTEAWTALIRALFNAGLTVTATYPIDTELTTALKKEDSSLSTSITVACRPRTIGSAAAFRDVRREVEKTVKSSVHRFWEYGFRGADLIVACYGPAVGVFGRYERVERADGTPVGVPELLQLVRESALKAIAGEFTGDPLSRLYFVWANLYGTGEQAWDDARLVIQVGGDAEDAMEVARRVGLFVVDGATCRLALLRDRAGRRNLGVEPDAPLIDRLHHALLLWKTEQRDELLLYLRDQELIDDTAFWKLAQALFEVLPRGEEDWKLISVLLGERETLRSAVRRMGALG